MELRFLSVAMVLGSALSCLAQTLPAAPRPKFTLGPQTTLIEEPLNADGTVDYLPAINELLGKGVIKDNNAAPLLLSLADHRLPRDEAELAALHVPVPGVDAPVLQGFDDYLSKHNTVQPPAEDDWTRFLDRANKLLQFPWTADREKDAADWIKENEPALAIAEQAAVRPNCFLPLVADKEKHLAIEGLPVMSSLLRVPKVFLSRAMLRAGEGRLPDALADLNRARLLARLANQEHFGIGHIMALAIEMQAMQSFAGVANAGLSRENLAKLRREIESHPDIPGMDDTTLQVEEMFTLDALMSFIRGDRQPLLRLQAMVFSKDAVINEGDLDKTDWDVALGEVVRLFDESRKTPDKAFADELKEVDSKIAAAASEKYPLSLLSLTDGKLEDVQKSVEAFLRMREGEARAAYSKRIGHWLSAGSPQDDRRTLLLEERPRTARRMALVAIALAEYRLDHGQYPDSLQALLGTDLLDACSGKEFLYRREKDDYVLWSVGMNQKDDGGKVGGDDIVVRSRPTIASN